MDKINQDGELGHTPTSIFTFNIPVEYRSYVEDLSRMIMIQVVANILFNLSNPKKYPFFSCDFILTLLFIVAGVSAYWLILRKIISFGPDSDSLDTQQFYYGKGI